MSKLTSVITIGEFLNAKDYEFLMELTNNRLLTLTKTGEYIAESLKTDKALNELPDTLEFYLERERKTQEIHNKKAQRILEIKEKVYNKLGK